MQHKYRQRSFFLKKSRPILYVSTAEEEEPVDLGAVNKKLTKINQLIDEKAKEHNQFLMELGLSLILKKYIDATIQKRQKALSIHIEKPFKLEKEIPYLFEQNLELMTHDKLIKSEFTIKSNRINTLAFDEESKAFVIIEYGHGRQEPGNGMILPYSDFGKALNMKTFTFAAGYESSRNLYGKINDWGIANSF